MNSADGGMDLTRLLTLGLMPGLSLVLGFCRRLLLPSVGPLPASGPVSFRLWPLPFQGLSASHAESRYGFSDAAGLCPGW